MLIWITISDIYDSVSAVKYRMAVAIGDSAGQCEEVIA